jgi:DNA-binding LacI/PurR family transcriptional regulator
MPGGDKLAKELAIGRNTVEIALQQLEKEGLLVGQGARRRRLIVLPEGGLQPVQQRVAILVYENFNRNLDYMLDIQHSLVDAGHIAFFETKTMMQLGMDVDRVRRLVETRNADAWVVVSAPRDVLQWFSKQPVPAFALFGRRRRVNIAGTGPDHVTAIRTALKRLIALNHIRIVLLQRRATEPATGTRAALEEMRKHGLPTGPYNAPVWEDSPEGLRKILDELFRVTAPTALIIDEAFIFHAVKEYLAYKGIFAPKQISLICIGWDLTFKWSEPSVAHIHWDSRPWVRHIVRWANDVSRGEDDRKQGLTKTRFVDGGTVGPAREKL